MKIIRNYQVTYGALYAGIFDITLGDALACMICGNAHILTQKELDEWMEHVASAKKHGEEHEHALTDMVDIEVACPSCKGINKRFQMMQMSGLMRDGQLITRLLETADDARRHILDIRSREVPVEALERLGEVAPAQA